MQLSPGTKLHKGKYNIKCVLGQGGFGITYLALMKIEVQGPLGMIESEVQVAIKEFFMRDLCNRDSETSHVSVPSLGSRELVDKFRKKFIKEANNIAALQHPHIIKVIEVFEEKGTAYYVMEYIEGFSLNELVNQQGALPEAQALTYIRQTASALDYLHQKRINHLDIKPANILLRKSGDIVLIDFGLAKQYDVMGEQTSSTPVGVSVGYAPIEQSTSGGVSQFSAPTDIYSLGATLYKLITGETPPSASEVMNEGLPPLPKSVGAPVVAAIQKAMEPGRKKRPQSIEEFLNLLGGVYGGEETKVKEDVMIQPPKKEKVAAKPKTGSKKVKVVPPKPEPVRKVAKIDPPPRVGHHKIKWWSLVLIVVLSAVCVFFLFWMFWNPSPPADLTPVHTDVVEISDTQDISDVDVDAYNAAYQKADNLLKQGKYANAQKEFEAAQKLPGCPPQNDIDAKITECKQKLADEQKRAAEQKERQERQAQEAKEREAEAADLVQQANSAFNNRNLGASRVEYSFQLYKRAKDLGGDVSTGYANFLSLAETLIENGSGFDANVKKMLQFAQQLNDTQKVRELLEKCE